MIAWAVLILALILPLYLVCLPAMDRRERLRTVLAAETAALEDVRALAARHTRLCARSDKSIEAAQTRPKGFSLFSHIDRLARKTGVKDHIGYMKPGTRDIENSSFHMDIVALRLKGVFFNDLAAFVMGIESEETGVGISAVTLSKTGKTGKQVRMDAVMEIQALVPGEGK